MSVGDKRTGKRVKNERYSTAEYSLDTLYDKFYYAKVAEGVTDRTLESYRENYRFFTEYLSLIGYAKDIRHVTPDLFREYITWMLKDKVRFEGHKYKSEEEQTVGLSPVTVNTRMKTLKTMFNYLYSEGIIEGNPAHGVKKVEEDEEEIIILTADELRLLMSAPNQRRYAGFRDYVLMNVLTDGFMRISEALSITKEAVDFEIGGVTIKASTSKSRRSRWIPLEKPTLKLLAELIRENNDFNTSYVFLANYGERLADGQFRHRLKEYAKKVGITKRVHPHLYRHTSATMYLEDGGDIRHLQKIMGHKDLRQLIRYTHLSDKSLINQHKKYSPIYKVHGKLERERKIIR
jgi:integrase/recombinase XerD